MNKHELVSNIQYWNTQNIVENQNKCQRLFWYEEFLLRLVKAKMDSIGRIHVIGCGTGREIQGIRKTFPDAEIVSSDISEKMVELCKLNLEKWGITKNVSVINCEAKEISLHYGNSDLIIAYNAVLTYILPQQNRVETLIHLSKLLAETGCIIGVVHNRYGRLRKTTFFLLQSVLTSIGVISTERGDRIGGYGGVLTNFHYFTSKELKKLLEKCEFSNTQVISLAKCAKKLGRFYNPLNNYNHLLFYAETKSNYK